VLCPEFLEAPIGERHERRGLIFKAIGRVNFKLTRFSAHPCQ